MLFRMSFIPIGSRLSTETASDAAGLVVRGVASSPSARG